MTHAHCWVQSPSRRGAYEAHSPLYCTISKAILCQALYFCKPPAPARIILQWPRASWPNYYLSAQPAGGMFVITKTHCSTFPFLTPSICLYLTLNLQWYEKFPSRTSLNRQSPQLFLSLSSLNKAGKEDAVNLAVTVLYVKG